MVSQVNEICYCTCTLCVHVIWKYFDSKKSAGEHATLYQLRNLLHCTNVVSKLMKDINACYDYFKLVVTCHILAASLQTLQMKSLGDTPFSSLISGCSQPFVSKLLTTLFISSSTSAVGQPMTQFTNTVNNSWA